MKRGGRLAPTYARGPRLPGADLAPHDVNTGLATLRPLIAAVTFDPETRILEVNFTPWPHETKVGVVPTAPRGSHSGCNALWRVRA